MRLVIFISPHSILQCWLQTVDGGCNFDWNPVTSIKRHRFGNYLFPIFFVIHLCNEVVYQCFILSVFEIKSRLNLHQLLIFFKLTLFKLLQRTVQI